MGLSWYRSSRRGAARARGLARGLALCLTLCLALGASGVGGAGCTNLRYYATYKYEHVRTEREKTPLPEKRYLSGIFKEQGKWVLKVIELRRCEQKVVEVARETAHVTITSPTWFYFVGLGALQASLSTPFWVLGARAKTAKDSRDHYLVGTLVFLIPGLAITAVGAWFKLVSGTEKRPMGLKRRVKKRTVVACGTERAAQKRVTLGTRTGPRRLGKTDAQGLIPLPADQIRPLVRWQEGQVGKVYFEVFVEDAPSQEVKVPKGFPVHPADLREPALRGAGGPRRAAPPRRRASPRRAAPRRRASPRRAAPRRRTAPARP